MASNLIDPLARKRAAIEAAKAKAASTSLTKDPVKIEFIPAEDATNKIRIIADNSSSMSSWIQGKSAMEHAKKGIVEFLRNCVPNKDAVAIHLLNEAYKYNYNSEHDDYDTKALAACISNSLMETDLIKLAVNIDVEEVAPRGGTPLYETISKAQESTPKATRYITFSDGEPNNYINEEKVIERAVKEETPIDTVFFGSSDISAETMKRLADKTGGIFLKFDPAKGVDFKTAFKYLAPGKRLMLMNAEFKQKLEAGEIKA